MVINLLNIDFLYNDDAGNSDDNIGIHNEIYMNPGYNGDD